MAVLALNLGSGFLTLCIPGWFRGFLILIFSCMASSLLLGLIRPMQILSIIKEK
jgi:hypothetical protein